MRDLEVWYSHVTADDVLALVRAAAATSRVAKKAGAKARRRGCGEGRRRGCGLTRMLWRPRRWPIKPKGLSPRHAHATTCTRSQAHRGRRRRAAHPRRSAPAGAGRRRRDRRAGRDRPPGVRRLQAHARRRPSRAGRALRVRRHGAQGGRCGQRRDSLPDRAHQGSRRRRPLFLQLKQAGPSVLETHLGRSVFRNSGHRVVAGQRFMQAHSDIFLGWIRGSGAAQRDFYWRQLRDMKGSVDVVSTSIRAVWSPTRNSAAGAWHAPTRAAATHRDRLVPGRRRPFRPRYGRLRRGLRRSRRARPRAR